MQNHLEELGGITRFCTLIGEGFEQRGYQVEVGAVSPPVNAETGAYPSRWKTWTLTEEMAPHVRKSLLGKNRSRKAVDQFKQQVGQAANAVFSEYGDDTLVIFTQLYARELVGPACDVENRFGRFSLVGMYHGSYLGATLTGDAKRVLAQYAEADKFLALTESDASCFRALGLTNVGHMANPIGPIPRSTYPDSSRIVVSLGRYSREKSLDHLINAWALVGEETAGWQLKLFGEGEERTKLSRLIESRNLDNVTLEGTTTEALKEIEQAAFTVQSSQHEGQPIALLESSAVGRPCVAYDCTPGVAEIVLDGKTGYLANANDIDDLARGISEMIRSPLLRERMGRNAHVHVQEKFSLEKVMNSWQELLEEVSL